MRRWILAFALLFGVAHIVTGLLIMASSRAAGAPASESRKLLVLWLAMVGSIAATRDNRHIRIDALSHLLPDKAVVAVRLIVDVFAAIVCGVVAWQATAGRTAGLYPFDNEDSQLRPEQRDGRDCLSVWNPDGAAWAYFRVEPIFS